MATLDGGLFAGERGEAQTKIGGTVVAQKKTVLDWTDLKASVTDYVDELFGQKISIQLVSSVVVHGDVGSGIQAKLSKPASLENWNSDFKLKAEETAFRITFELDEEIGSPGAIIVKNFHHSEFYLKSVTLENVPGSGRIHFVCNSWIYPVKCYKNDRVFFTNQSYLPSQTPAALIEYREEELLSLRGGGEEELKEWHRVYDYAYYNDLGDPDKGPDYVRQVLGGSAEYPYPRRSKTGRAASKTDPKTESRLSTLMCGSIYVPRDERLSGTKMADLVAYGVKLVNQILGSAFGALDTTPREFDSFEDVFDLYKGKIKKTDISFLQKIGNTIPSEVVKELIRSDGENFLKLPPPHVIIEDKSAWSSDEEFARETLAGTNPNTIRRLEIFPPRSKLDPEVYGNQNSSIVEENIEKNLNGMSIEQAMKMNKVFIVDHHDFTMPYLRRINATTSTKTYATRTLFFLMEDGTLKPIAIELSLPHPDGDHHGSVSKVYTPDDHGVEGSLWNLAKIYAAVNDSGYHQLISHWLHTHAVMEPFVIATNRQLSVLHPVYKLLHPHFKDTMFLNAVARLILINAGGTLERLLFPQKYSMEVSSQSYKSWTFPTQALPVDLITRGIAVEDSEHPYGIRLLIEDYPYAVDGLDIWFAIETWVRNYCCFYYKSDDMIREDSELRAWWTEVREKGHADKKDEPWWPKMETLNELVDSCTIIIWVASCLHAAVNFGQYPYAGFPPNRPTLSRQLVPEQGSVEYEDLKVDPMKYILRTLPNRAQAMLGILTIEAISRHTSDEVYLGQRESKEWTSDVEPLAAFSTFGNELQDIERKIMARNDDGRFKNRLGPVKMPYNLLFPTSDPGLTAKGIPNSVSI